jgi:hypothetical protein
MDEICSCCTTHDPNQSINQSIRFLIPFLIILIIPAFNPSDALSVDSSTNYRSSFRLVHVPEDIALDDVEPARLGLADDVRPHLQFIVDGSIQYRKLSCQIDRRDESPIVGSIMGSNTIDSIMESSFPC